MSNQPLKRTKEEQKMLDDIEREPNVVNQFASSYVEMPTDKEIDQMMTTVIVDDPGDPEGDKAKHLIKMKTIDKVYRNKVNPLATNLITTDVKEKTVEGYFGQISHNFFIGAKAVVFMCRDIVLAKKTLTADDYEKLSDSLSGFMSRTTIAKYETIGECDKLYKKLHQNTLPLQWTTQYQLAKLSDEDWQRVEKHLTANTTMKDIDELLGKVKLPPDPTFKYEIEDPKDFIRIACKRGSQDAVLMTKLSQKIQEVVDEINATEVKYFLRDEDDSFECEMSVNEKFITQTDEKALKFMKSSKVGGIATRYLEAKKNLPKLASFLRRSVNDFMTDKQSA
tara:strand:+ start:198 stop:1208 length:1011 start_codon:yes stop_codon:yes gene_type:complete